MTPMRSMDQDHISTRRVDNDTMCLGNILARLTHIAVSQDMRRVGAMPHSMVCQKFMVILDLTLDLSIAARNRGVAQDHHKGKNIWQPGKSTHSPNQEPSL